MILKGEIVMRKSLGIQAIVHCTHARTLLLGMLLSTTLAPGLARSAASAAPTAPSSNQQTTSAPQPPPPVAGKVRSLAGDELTVGTLDHGDVAVTLGPDARVVVNRPGTLADVRAGDFIGTTAVEGTDGKLRASEVHVFPEALRGTGEGHYPWGTTSGTTMTNGSVRSMTNGSVASRNAGDSAGVSLDVTYRGGASRVEVAPDVPVVVITLADRSLLTPGTPVLAFGQPDGAGGLAANLVAILPPPAAAPAR